MNRRILALALAASFALPLFSSCVINTNTRVESSGRQVSQETLAQITPGRTSEFVLALLGEPSTRSKIDANSDIWKWEYSEKRVKEGGLLFVFSNSETTVQKGAVYVELKDGLVARTWRD